MKKITDTMSRCPACKETKDNDEFAFSNKEKGIRQNSCNECRREKAKIIYHTYDKQAAIRRAVASERRKRARIKAWKATLSCAFCPEDTSCCLCFHHVSRRDGRDVNIWALSFPKLKEELSKCIAVCCNCHMKIHHDDFKVSPAIAAKLSKQLLQSLDKFTKNAPVAQLD